jgi:2-keto-4-pentenoate hydratase/2-oxohepta-3-ene-1,7-dioic acid hydratase in catechol pathway
MGQARWCVFSISATIDRASALRVDTKETPMKRRSIIETTATLGIGALAGCALPGSAAQTPKTPFDVADTYIPIVGSDMQYPVRRIYCIGRNYAAHAREMGSDPNREPPFFFQKPTDAIQNVAPGTVADHPYPTLTKNYHYEVELVAALHKAGAASRWSGRSTASTHTGSAWT